VDEEENLEEGEVCVLALKAYSFSGARAEEMDGEGAVDCADDEKRCRGDRRFLCAGALVRRPASAGGTYDAWTADAETDGDEVNLQLEGAFRVLDGLFLRYLEERAGEGALSRSGTTLLGRLFTDLAIQCGTPNGDCTCASYRAATLRGFRPAVDMLSCSPGETKVACPMVPVANSLQQTDGMGGMELLQEGDGDTIYNEFDGLRFDFSVGLERYREAAKMQHRSSVGIIAEQILNLLSRSV